MYIKLLQVLIININVLILYINCFNLKTQWCREGARCRLQDECLNQNAVPDQSCPNQGSVCCPDSNLPKQLCNSFGQTILKQQNDVAIGFHSGDGTHISCANTNTPLIIGGEKAKSKEFPYMAAIGYGKSRKNAFWHCGGTLISRQHVLSAAHCLKSKLARSDAKWVILGAIDLKDEKEPGRQTFDIVKRVTHPKYRQPAKTYDIIIFKLSQEVVINEYVRPACLNMDDTLNMTRVFATGWGKTDYFNEEGNDVLMKVTLDLIPYNTCEGVYKNENKKTLPLGVHDSMLCAGTAEGGKDTCQGDSGGPLTINLQEPRCMYSVIAVTSFGKFCGYANSPAIYTRVSYFIPWIVKELSQDLQSI